MSAVVLFIHVVLIVVVVVDVVGRFSPLVFCCFSYAVYLFIYFCVPVSWCEAECVCVVGRMSVLVLCLRV